MHESIIKTCHSLLFLWGRPLSALYFGNNSHNREFPPATASVSSSICGSDSSSWSTGDIKVFAEVCIYAAPNQLTERFSRRLHLRKCVLENVIKHGVAASILSQAMKIRCVIPYICAYVTSRREIKSR